MKETVSVILIATLAISSVVGVTAAVTKGDKLNTVSSSVVSTGASFNKKNNLKLADVTGTWQHVKNPYCTVQVLNQNGNKLDLLIESRNESATKIATAKTSVTLNLWKDGDIVRGESEFGFTDSFGNSGNGSISVSENKITVVINEIVELGRGWSIGNVTGDYVFKCDAVTPTATPAKDDTTDKSDTTDKELTLPDVTGTWMNESNPHCTIQIFNQSGNTIDFMIESSNDSYTKIANAKTAATLNLRSDGAVVRGDADFNFTDSFGNSGNGCISVSENKIILVINDINEANGWSIGNATGEYILKSDDVTDNTKSEVTIPDVTGTWIHEYNPHCSIQVNNQCGNTLDLTIESSNDSYTKIATAKVSVTLSTWKDDVAVRGNAGFNFTDSFGNVGSGHISVCENEIILVIDYINETNVWSIGNTTGEYILQSR